MIVELRQHVFNYGRTDCQPEGVLAPALLIFPGTHGRLDNLDEEGRFIKDEVFWYAGKRVEHRAGASGRGLMKGFVDLRKKQPGLFKDLIVMQQPAAFLDGVLHKWVLEDQAKLGSSLFQRDSLATTMSKQALEKMGLAWQLQAIVAGKMTPVLQLTDTDFAYLFKSNLANAKASLQQELKATASRKGERADMKYGLYEVMKLLQEAFQATKKQAAERNLVLAGLRRNGMLTYRHFVVRPSYQHCPLTQVTCSRPQGLS